MVGVPEFYAHLANLCGIRKLAASRIRLMFETISPTH